MFAPERHKMLLQLVSKAPEAQNVAEVHGSPKLGYVWGAGTMLAALNMLMSWLLGNVQKAARSWSQGQMTGQISR